MSDTVKRLTASKPAAATLTDCSPTVPAAKGWIVSTIFINNQSGTADGYAIQVGVGGAAGTDADYIYGSSTRYAAIPPDATWAMTVGFTVNAGDIIRVKSQNGTSTFSFFGSERDQ